MKGKRGRPPAAFFSVQEAARLLDLPETLVRRKLLAPGRSFFPNAFEQDGEWWIPEREMRRFMERSLEQLYSVRSAAEWLGLSYFTVSRAVSSGKIPSVTVLGEIRIRESALLATQLAPPTRRRRLSFFGQDERRVS